MNNIEKLKEVGILGDIRMRIGAKDENDDSCDSFIETMDNWKIIFEWSAWHIGDGNWWRIMKDKFDKLEKLDDYGKE